MRTTIPHFRTALVSLFAAVTLGPITTALPPKPQGVPPVTRCWSISSSACLDCPTAISWFCVANPQNGTFSECLSVQAEACATGTCGEVIPHEGPPCGQ